jgi:hypothetical protein
VHPIVRCRAAAARQAFGAGDSRPDRRSHSPAIDPAPAEFARFVVDEHRLAHAARGSTVDASHWHGVRRACTHAVAIPLRVKRRRGSWEKQSYGVCSLQARHRSVARSRSALDRSPSSAARSAPRYRRDGSGPASSPAPRRSRSARSRRIRSRVETRTVGLPRRHRGSSSPAG